MKQTIHRRFTAILLILCMTLSMFASVSIARPTHTEAANPPNPFKAGAVNMAVSKLYTFGLSAVGTGLTKLADTIDCPELQAIVSFLDKWVFGNGQKKSNAALVDLCKQILAELKVIETTLSEYTAQIEQSLGEQNFTQAMKSVNAQWELDVHSLEGSGIEDALAKYKSYMSTAQDYADKKASEADMDNAEAALFNEFCNMYKTKVSVPVEENTPEKLRAKIFEDTIVNDIFHASISSMKNNLVKDTNYADILAQFAYQALPFADQQYEYVKMGINQQLTEITLLEMLYQEFLSQYGNYLEEKYPGNQAKWDGYTKFLEDFDQLNTELAENITTMLNRELKVFPAQGITLRLDQYPTEADTGETILQNTEFEKSISYSASSHHYTSEPRFIYKNETFQKAFTLTKSGINTFYIKTNANPDALLLRNFDFKLNISNEGDEHQIACDFINLTEKTYTNGNLNKKLRCAQKPSDISQLFNSNSYQMSGSIPQGYLARYLSYAKQNPVFLIFPGYKKAKRNWKWETAYASFQSVINASEAHPYADFDANRTSTLSLENIQAGKNLYNSYYCAIFVNEGGQDQYSINLSQTGSGSSELYIREDGRNYSYLIANPGKVINIRFRALKDTVPKSLTLQTHKDAMDKNKASSETVLLTREQILNLVPDEDGYYSINLPACYGDETIVLETEQARKVTAQNVGAFKGELVFDTGSDLYTKGEKVCFSVSDEVSRAYIQYQGVKQEIPLADNGKYGINGEFTMPDTNVTLYYETKDTHHVYNEEGFCTNASCGFYQPALKNAEGTYEISNAGQLFWFASLINGDKSLAEFTAKDSAAPATLASDIDLGGREWKPIREYSGTFDGQGHAVRGLKITMAQDDSGFFGRIAGAGIRSLAVQGDIALSSNASNIGGVVGYANGGTLEQILSYVNISNTDGALTHTGGIIGAIQNSETIVDKCMYYGTMEIKDSGDCIGGIAGYSNGGARISNCANLGTIHTTYPGAFTGGILGYVNNSGPEVRNCYNYGLVSNDGNTKHCGAVIGYGKWYEPAKVTNNYYLDASSSLAFGSGGRIDGSGTAKTIDQFASGEVAWLLNQAAADGTPVWFQNLDNGQTPDAYPLLSGAVVYFQEASQKYSNYSGRPDAFEMDAQGRLQISSYEQLVQLSKLVRSDYGIYGAQHYILTNNIVVDTDSFWTAGIGSVIEDKPFNGTFDGQGYCIMGLQIANPEYGGLFEYIGGNGIVRNLITLNDSYKFSCANAGSIAAVNEGSIEHCTNGINVSPYFIFPHPGTKKPVQAITFNSQIDGTVSGGITARNAGTITGCRNAGTVLGKVCGGIAGINTGQIYGCANNGTIGSQDSPAETAGGIAGKNGGIIESSYQASELFVSASQTSGAIAGLNGYDSAAKAQISGVYYRTADSLHAVGTDSVITMMDTTVIAKEADDMRSDTFTEELNSLTDQRVRWCRSGTMNGGYPKVENQLFRQMTRMLKHGISVKGSMHSSLNINYDPLEKDSDAYLKLVSNVQLEHSIDDSSVIKGYSLSLTDEKGIPMPAELWTQGELELSVPAEHSNILLAGLGSDGQVIECRPVSYENGVASFHLPELMSFVILDTAKASASQSKLDTPVVKAGTRMLKQPPARTGDSTDLGLWISLLAAAAVVGIGTATVMERRRNKLK